MSLPKLVCSAVLLLISLRILEGFMPAQLDQDKLFYSNIDNVKYKLETLIGSEHGIFSSVRLANYSGGHNITFPTIIVEDINSIASSLTRNNSIYFTTSQYVFLLDMDENSIILMAGSVDDDAPFTNNWDKPLLATDCKMSMVGDLKVGSIRGYDVLYFSDASAIRKLTTEDGMLTIIAGNNLSGGFGDDGPYIGILSVPHSLELVPNGNDYDVYLSEPIYRIVRKIDRNGVISIVAGNYTKTLASSSGSPFDPDPLGIILTKPTGLLYMPTFNQLLFMDNTRLLSLNLISNTLTLLSSEYALCREGADFACAQRFLLESNNQIISIQSLNTVKRHFFTGKEFNTFNIAGNSQKGNGGDNGQAIHAQLKFLSSLALVKKNLFLSTGSKIRVINTQNMIISTVLDISTGYYFNENIDIGIYKPLQPTQLGILKTESGKQLVFLESESNSVKVVNLTDSKISKIPTLGSQNSGYPSVANPLDFIENSSNELIIANDKNYWTGSFVEKILSPRTRSQFIIGDPSFNRSVGADSMPILEAVLERPNGICIEDGIIYFTDSYNHAVKMITNGKVITLSSRYKGHIINTPTGIAVYKTKLYFSDSKNNQIKVIDLNNINYGPRIYVSASGIAGFLDGNISQALLNNPQGLSVHLDGLYIADSFNHRIRHVDLVKNLITTVAGTGIQGYNGDSIYPQYAHLNTPMGVFGRYDGFYIADSYNHRIRSVLYGSIQTVVGNERGGSSDGRVEVASLFYPQSVIEVDEMLYICDTFNNRVRSFGMNEKFLKTIAGGDSEGFSGDDGLAKNARLRKPQTLAHYMGVLYLVDTYNNRIRTIDLSTNIIKNLVGGIGDYGKSINAVGMVTGVAIDSTNSIYLSDSLHHLIRKIDSSGYITSISGSGNYGYNGDGKTAPSADLASPNGIITTPSGDVIFCDTNNNIVRQISNGYVYTIAGNTFEGYYGEFIEAKNSHLNHPMYIRMLPNEDLIFTDSRNQRVRRLTKTSYLTYIIETIAHIPNTNSEPIGIAFDEGIIYFSDRSLNKIYKLTPYCESGFVLNSDSIKCNPLCFGISNNETNTVCSGNGKCTSPDKCQCTDDTLFGGLQCDIPVCGKILATSEEVCSFSNGTCVSSNKCICNEGYKGSLCEIPVCFEKSLSQSCSNSGTCKRKDFCECNIGFEGLECEIHSSTNLITGLVIGSVSLLLLVGIVAIILAITFRKYYKQRKILQTDLFLDERLLDGYSAAELTDSKISKDESFIINLNELNMDKPIKRLGSGAFGSVFKTYWNGIIVAVKVFDLRDLNISEEDFKLESLMLSKLRHPNIINFYGISSTPTKRFIVMECLDSSLDKTIVDLQNGTISYSIRQKLDILIGIANGIYYLHHLTPRYIVHRDLKPANILLDKNGVCKLCDFGLSKLVSHQTQTAITANIGTAYFIAPELLNPTGESDNSEAKKCDIYSYSIIMYQTLFEISDPYCSASERVIKKLKMDSPLKYQNLIQLHISIVGGLRPKIPFHSLEECSVWCEENITDSPTMLECKVLFELVQLIQQCWASLPIDRPNIEQVLRKLSDLASELESPLH